MLYNLKDSLDPDDHCLLVLTAKSALSKMILSRDMYTVTIALTLKKKGEEPYKFLTAPQS